MNIFNSKFIRKQNKTKLNNTQKRNDIQALRGIAVIAVLLNHSSLNLAGGFIGVDIFFVISGFFIAEIIKHQYQSNNTIDLQIFYIRRLLRLIPGLIFVSIIVCVSMIFFNNPSGAQQNSAKTAIATNFFIGNYVIQQGQNDYFANNSIYNPLMHYWTLSVEWQFYIIFPLMALFYIRFIKDKFDKLMMVSILAILLVFYLNYVLSRPSSNSDYFMITFRVWEFIAGISCTFIPKQKFANKYILLSLRISAYVVLVFCILFIDKYSKLPGPVLITPVLATFVLIYSGSNSITYRSYFFKILIHIGNISYPVYLWHWPVFITLQYLFPNIAFKIYLYLGFTYLLSLFTHKFIEEPFRYYDGNPRTSITFIAKITSINLIISLVVGFLSSEIMYKYVVENNLQTDISGSIYNFSSIDEITLQVCNSYGQRILYKITCLSDVSSLNSKSSYRNILVIGDSHAKHLLSGLANTYPKANVNYVATNNFHKVPSDYNSNFKLLMNSIKNQDIIIISSFWDEFGINSQLNSYLQSLSQSNHKIFVDFGTPKFSFSSFRCKFGVSLFLTNKLCDNNREFSINKRVLTDLKIATVNISRVIPLYSYKAFCDKHNCSMSKRQNIYFYDSNHLNKLGSVYLIQYFTNNYSGFNFVRD